MNSLEQLHQLQGELVEAQRQEDATMAALAAYTRQDGNDLSRFRELMDATTRAHEATMTIYNAWKSAAAELMPRV